ncbi:putative transporter [Campylobacter sp. JMF_06 NA1]|uniref:putative transporter n=1 Tax=Campylobacter sp. JMF_06 NA1 TaxID=2983823 RepID=UPI0022E9B836|nr:putative transporter [Campylobacter sp. JMF_06 NA1]MDA3078518.1 putative transporter [Campylobacter sp. JMF_06 NA1]
MFSSFFKSKKWRILAWGGLIFILGINLFQTILNVKFNEWYRAFYDMGGEIDKHTIDEFYEAMLLFLWLAMWFIFAAVSERYITRVWVLKWREAMTFSYIGFWRRVERDIEGSSQRIQEDIYRFTKTLEDVGMRIVYAFMTLFAFIPILWGLSSGINLPFIKDIPGSLVWIALAVSVGGLGVSWFVGRYLPRLEYNNQKVEAAFRKELVFAEEDKANYGSEEKLISLFDKLKFNYHKLFLHYLYFDTWLHTYSQILVIVPYLIMGPGLFTKVITLGVLIQTANAFNKVRQSFSVFTENWTTITELRSIHMRLSEFEKNIGYDPKLALQAEFRA